MGDVGLWGTAKLFDKVTFNILTSNVWKLQFPKSSSALDTVCCFCCCFCLISHPSNRYEVVSLCALCAFSWWLMMLNVFLRTVGHLYVFFREMSFLLLPTFKLGYLHFYYFINWVISLLFIFLSFIILIICHFIFYYLLLSCRNALCILGTSCLSDMWYPCVFSQSIGCFFT